MDEDLEQLDLGGLAAAASVCASAEMAAGCRLLQIAAIWADNHPADGIFHQRTPLAVAGERTMQFGGEGTPDVAEFAPAELAPEIGESVYQATSLLADALDLRHRFPMIWRRVTSGSVRARLARRVAFRTRTLTTAQAAEIDAEIAPTLGQLSFYRLELRLDAAILRVDHVNVARRAEEAAKQRSVRMGRSTEEGLTTIYATMDTPDAIALDATVDRLADILAGQRDALPAGVPDRAAQSKDEWRAVAAGLLGKPLIAARVIADHEQPDLFDDLEFGHDPTGDVREQADPDDVPEHAHSDKGPELVEGLQPDAASTTPGAPRQPAAAESGNQSRTAPNPQPAGIWAPRDRERLLLELARRIDPNRLAPRSVLHIHISPDAIDGSTDEVRIARVEQLGPHLISTVRQWLDGSRVSVQTIIDSDRIPSVDRYEVPAMMAEALLARSPGSVFPWSSGRHLDHDHTIPYRPPPSGPPGQTGLGKLGPLSRREHRFKTHGRISVLQPDAGTFVWRTRFGRVLITNPAGTHDLGGGPFADAVWRAAISVDDPTGVPAGDERLAETIKLVRLGYPDTRPTRRASSAGG
ncbi:DUF222 domain-containing protein [Microlunatus soli]|uniref:DUF222 domain-containing protein n=1 Tax=Microlunatus soli TaxID=630515 RepID=A0A1H1V3Y2_9ACTN|nr:DUF222 domain-containing protein [Microlunatus soli]SDS79435.1 protein of unknown function [Microlunatus soli]